MSAALFPSPAARPLGYFQVTSLAAAVTLAAACGGAVPAGATYVLVQAEAQVVRWRDDATAPTATVGMTLAAGGAPQGFVKSEFAGLSFIAAVSGAILNISVYA